MIKKFLIFFVFISSCVNSTDFEKKDNKNFEVVYFEAVEKNIIYNANLPSEFQEILDHWFNNSVKVNGFDGVLTLNVDNFTQNISDIDKGKRVDLFLDFELKIENAQSTKKKLIKGKLHEFSEIEGNFSINEFDILIYNTMVNMVSKLSSKFK